MNKYRYIATDKNGKKIKGTFVAENETEMKEMLLKSGYYVTYVRQASTTNFSSFFSVSGKVKTKEISQFCNQFSVMISAGISIPEAIDVTAKQNFTKKLKNALAKISDDLKQGVLLSEAMAKFPKIFPPYFSSMVFIGESAGCLDRVLVSVAEYYEFEEKTRRKVKGSLAYPLVLLVMLGGVVALMLGFVIPAFMDAFSKMNIEMPALTMAIFNMSIFFREYGLYVLAFLASFIIIIWALHFLPSVRFFFHRMKVTLPVFKKINLALFTSRFCRALGLLLSSGADTLSALENLKKTIANEYLRMQFDRVMKNVRMGMSLSSSLKTEMEVSPVLIQMLIVGERTGEMDVVLIKTAPYFDAQAEAALNLITTILQPAIMVLLGLAVGTLFLAVYSPILQMVQNLRS